MTEVVYEFGLNLSDKYAKNIHLFNTSVPETIDEGLNGCFQEKIRRFNNSATHLAECISAIESVAINNFPLFVLCQDIGNETDVIYRRMLRNVYMELFIYQEKLLNIVCNLFFVKVTKSRQSNLDRLKKRIIYSEPLKKFCDSCNTFIKDPVCQKVMAIRDDEVHNMSQIDSFYYDLEKVGDGVRPVTKGDRVKASELRDNYIYTMNKLLDIRNIVQEILDQSDFWEIYYALQKDGQEIWIN